MDVNPLFYCFKRKISLCSSRHLEDIGERRQQAEPDFHHIRWLHVHHSGFVSRFSGNCCHREKCEIYKENSEHLFTLLPLKLLDVNWNLHWFKFHSVLGYLRLDLKKPWCFTLGLPNNLNNLGVYLAHKPGAQCNSGPKHSNDFLWNEKCLPNMWASCKLCGLALA